MTDVLNSGLQAPRHEPSNAPLSRMVPRESPSQETLTGALMVMTKQQEEIKAKLDRLISDAVALRATM